ncbi:hypothetical protein F0562_022560 [Nyssa sinensis]|uniref:USP domain-containing protein n=1 Tax=Nyssa sinensis TaxID=561372 RepID=A0A5J5BTK0_9ASTE|nr:hypothetical protein F0562_022560 [Nyssa sinensis]
MGNDSKKTQGGLPRFGRTNGFITTSFRALSSYLWIVSSGVSTVASTVQSATSAVSAIVDRDNDASHDQVHWAAFDNLEGKGDITWPVLLLDYQFGFLDVEDALQKFFQLEVLDGNNKYNCENCMKLVAEKKQMFIFQAPNVLVIQLNRFEGILVGRPLHLRKFWCFQATCAKLADA